MRDRHIKVEQDSALLKQIRKAVEDLLPIDPQRVISYLWLKFLFYVSGSVILYFSLFVIAEPAIFLMTYTLYGLFALLLAFNFAHDFSHDTIFSNKKWNNLAFTVIYSIVGAHAEAWKERHINSHHYAPNVKDYDSDLQITGIIRVVPGSPHKWYHRYQHLYAPIAYTSYSLFWVFIKDVTIYFTTGKREGTAYHLSFWLQKCFYLSYLLLIPLLLSKQHWIIVLSGFMIMHLVQSLFLLFTFFMTHHVESTLYPTTNKDGMISSSWVMNQIKSSNDMHPFSPTANFILGGFNNHIAHHLFPQIHHFHYPRLNKSLYQVLEKNGIQPNCTTYWGGVISHLKLLKRMGNNKD